MNCSKNYHQKNIWIKWVWIYNSAFLIFSQKQKQKPKNSWFGLQIMHSMNTKPILKQCIKITKQSSIWINNLTAKKEKMEMRWIEFLFFCCRLLYSKLTFQMFSLAWCILVCSFSWNCRFCGDRSKTQRKHENHWLW